MITGVLDFETDPFLAGRVPFPFACGIYFAPNDYKIIWEPLDVIDTVIGYLKTLPACVLYAHNGGKFDFHYLLEGADYDGIIIRNGRLVQMKIGRVTLKDSWPLMPFALETFRKTKIDYAIFEKDKRKIPANKSKIRSYLLDDCADLFELVTGFRKITGEKDTIGAAAFGQMRKLGIEIRSLSEPNDDQFRHYFFGGRVEAFQKGEHHGNFSYLDINSAYPFAMLGNHAHGGDYARGDYLPDDMDIGNFFVHLSADSRGALPLRDSVGGLSFPHVANQEFFATGWEIKAGLETKTLRIRNVLDVWIPQNTICFEPFVSHFWEQRINAKQAGDKIGYLAFKYLLNSGFGKFAQNPRDFKDYCLEDIGKDVPGWDWETDFGAIAVWSKPSYNGKGFYDVATAASITGYVRAMLWKAICKSEGVLYCDTDSIICKKSVVKMGEGLGQWKEVGRIKHAAIAGKKLYAVEWVKPVDDDRYLIASKGARLSFDEVVSVCRGNVVEWENQAPTFSFGGLHFVKRSISQT